MKTTFLFNRIMKTVIVFVMSLFVFADISAQVSEFITTWKTDNQGASGTNQVRFPGYGSNYTLTWEEVGNPTNNGKVENVTVSLKQPYVEITFPNPGTYQIKVAIGQDFWGFKHRPITGVTYDNNKLLSVDNWGWTQWIDIAHAFYQCENMRILATDVPDLSKCNSLQWVFAKTKNFNEPINDWDVSTIKDLYCTFCDAEAFNQPLDQWDVSNVTTMRNTFSGLSAFNQPIGNWNVGNVTLMNNTFGGNAVFNQPLDNWDVSNVTNFGGIFFRAYAFNQNLGNWKLNSVAADSPKFTLTRSGLDCNNYSLSLMGWAANTNVSQGVTLEALGMQYGPAAADARNTLLNSKGWLFGTGASDSYNADCEVVTSVNPLWNNTSFTVYPNPASDILYVELPDEMSLNSNVDIYDFTGKLIKTTKINKKSGTINVSAFPKGIYLVKIGNTTHKVMIDK